MYNLRQRLFTRTINQLFETYNKLMYLRPEAAFKILDKIILLDSRNREYLLNGKLEIFLFSGRNEEALDLLDQRLIEDPQNNYFYKCKKEILLRIQRDSELLAHCDKWSQMNLGEEEPYLTKIEVLKRLGKEKSVLRCFDELAEKYPLNPQFFDKKIDYLVEIKKYDVALNCYTGLIARDPGSIVRYCDKYTLIKWLNKNKGAHIYFESQLRAAPNISSYLQEKIHHLLQEDNHEEAIHDCDIWISLERKNKAPVEAKLMIAKKLGKFDEALAFYDNLIAMTNDTIHFLKEKIKYLLEIRRYKEAADIYDTDIGPSFNYHEGYEMKIDLLKWLGRNDEALICCDSMIEFDPYTIYPLKRKVEFLVEIGRQTDATDFYYNEIAGDSNYDIYYEEKADMLKLLGNYDDALACYDRFIARNPAFSVYRCKIALLMELNKLDEALDCCNTFILKDQTNIQIHNDKIDILKRLGREKEADLWQERVNKIESNIDEGHYMRIDILLQYENYEEALECYDALMKIYPGDETIYEQKMSLLIKLGRIDEVSLDKGIN